MKLQSTQTSCFFETKTRTESDWGTSERSWVVRPGNISIPCWLGIQKNRRKSNRKHYAHLSISLRDFILGTIVVAGLTNIFKKLTRGLAVNAPLTFKVT